MGALALASGALLGLVHVLSGPDHLAAIAPLAARGGRWPWALGVRWGLGHSGGVLLVAFAALFARDMLPLEALSGWSERLVGVVLIGLGLWGFYRLMAREIDEHTHPARGRAAFAVGALHGLAGSSHLLGVLPALAQPTRADSLVYLVGFAAGTLAAMAAFSTAVGWLSARLEHRGAALHRNLCGATSAAAVVVGAWWLG